METWAPSSTLALSSQARPAKGRGKGNKGKRDQDQQQQPPHSKRRRTDNPTEVAEIADLCRATAALALETARKERISAGIASTTILLPSSAGVEGATAITAEGEGDDHRSHILRWASLVQGCVAAETMPQEQRALLQQHGSQHSSPDSLMAGIKTCTCSPTYGDASIIKVCICNATRAPGGGACCCTIP